MYQKQKGGGQNDFSLTRRMLMILKILPDTEVIGKRQQVK
jgi:hypothetical protein